MAEIKVYILIDRGVIRGVLAKLELAEKIRDMFPNLGMEIKEFDLIQ